MICLAIGLIFYKDEGPKQCMWSRRFQSQLVPHIEVPPDEYSTAAYI